MILRENALRTLLRRTLLSVLLATPVFAVPGFPEPMPRKTPQGYDIVLGSYAQRTIALRELVDFAACKQPLFVQPHEVDGVAMWRVVDGPYKTHADAQIVHARWLACGHADVWISTTLATPHAERD